MKFKLMTIVGTRPEIIRLSEIIKKVDQCFDQVLVHTGQNYDYELNQIFFDDLGLRQPDVFMDAAGGSLGETVGNIMAKSFDVIAQHNPDALLVLGDTNSCLSSYAAKRLKVPIFHLEAGNRCFDQNVPEEINRKIVDHISDINLPYTENSRRYLLSEGFKKEHIFVVGSPMTEVLNAHERQIDESGVLKKLSIQKNRYILVSAHREENIDSEQNFMDLMNGINKVAEVYDMPVIYSVHPRSKKHIEQRSFQFHKHVKEMKPFGFIDYNALQKNAYTVISDSGTLSEESALLSFPGVLIRTSTERPEAVDKGSVVIGGITAESMVNSIDIVRKTFPENGTYVTPVDYRDTNVSDKIVRIIQGYIPIVNEFIWRK